MLLLHGGADVDTRPDHSRRVYEALAGPKQLVFIRGAGHTGAMRADVWPAIERWIDRVLETRPERPIMPTEAPKPRDGATDGRRHTARVLCAAKRLRDPHLDASVCRT